MAENKETEKSSAKLLTLEEIAAWWLPKQMKRTLDDDKDMDTDTIQAALPALQRGFVWRPNQIELLWDSIAQGFPVGALLLSEYMKEPKEPIAMGTNSDGKVDKPTHFLLDGQQRATAIALGFRNIWTNNDADTNFKPTATLWVDMVLLADERRFAFRVLTKSHPWGYSRTHPNSTISAANARKALETFRILNGKEKTKLPHDFSINEVFPWDAKAPIPVTLLIEAIKKHRNNHSQVARHVLDAVYHIAFWGNELDSDIAPTLNKAEEILNRKDNEGLKHLIDGLDNALRNTKVPALLLTRHLRKPTSPTKTEAHNDENESVFNLFKRINTGGTTLSREDINYSMLKSIWPEAREVIEENLLEKRQIAQPARVVSVMARLALMTRNTDSSNKGLQPELSISDFRRHIEENELKERIKLLCKDKEENVLVKLWGFLTNGSYALPTVLAFRISRQGGDLLLLLLYWIHCMTEKGLWDCLSIENKTRSLGFVTALDWFSIDQKRCVKVLAQELIRVNNLECESLPDFFNRKQFQIILNPDSRGRILMIPIPAPRNLEDVVMDPTTKPAFEEDSTYKSDLWCKNKDIWDLYGGDNTPKTMAKFFRGQLYRGEMTEERRADREKIVRDAWWHLINRTFRERAFILYAQRSNIKKWFYWYDPTQPDQISDHNRPWDYDHILPFSWSHNGRGVYSNLPHLVRAWVNSIGNLRAWPMELNRSKRNSVIIEKEAPEYNLNSADDVCEASFIRNREDWERLNVQAKKEFSEPGIHWPIFVKASMRRTLDLYTEWYDQLHVEKIAKND